MSILTKCLLLQHCNSKIKILQKRIAILQMELKLGQRNAYNMFKFQKAILKQYTIQRKQYLNDLCIRDKK